MHHRRPFRQPRLAVGVEKSSLTAETLRKNPNGLFLCDALLSQTKT